MRFRRALVNDVCVALMKAGNVVVNNKAGSKGGEVMAVGEKTRVYCE